MGAENVAFDELITELDPEQAGELLRAMAGKELKLNGKFVSSEADQVLQVSFRTGELLAVLEQLGSVPIFVSAEERLRTLWLRWHPVGKPHTRRRYETASGVRTRRCLR